MARLDALNELREQTSRLFTIEVAAVEQASAMAASAPGRSSPGAARLRAQMTNLIHDFT